MARSETFGAEAGSGGRVAGWMSSESARRGTGLRARAYGEEVLTENFGRFDMLSWIGEAREARRLLRAAGRRFGVAVLEGGYRQRERSLLLRRTDYALVRRGGRVAGRVLFEAPLVGGSWRVRSEERARASR